jgi:hypothetical protein
MTRVVASCGLVAIVGALGVGFVAGNATVLTLGRATIAFVRVAVVALLARLLDTIIADVRDAFTLMTSHIVAADLAVGLFSRAWSALMGSVIASGSGAAANVFLAFCVVVTGEGTQRRATIAVIHVSIIALFRALYFFVSTGRECGLFPAIEVGRIYTGCRFRRCGAAIRITFRSRVVNLFVAATSRADADGDKIYTTSIS